MSALPTTYVLSNLSAQKSKRRTTLRTVPFRPRSAASQPKALQAAATDSGQPAAVPALALEPLKALQPAARDAAPPAAALAMDFATLYRTYRRRVYSQCFCMLHNQDDAEDATQEVFLQVFRKVHTFRGESSFSTWLHRLTTNCVLMEIRRKRHRCLEVTPREASPDAGLDKGARDAALDSFQAPHVPLLERITIGSAQSQLPVGYQRIFELHDVEGHTHEEIAALLGIQVGTSKSQLHKARLRMRVLL